MVGKGGFTAAAWPRSSILLPRKRFRVDHGAWFDLLCPFHYHGLTSFQSVFDNPHRAGAIADFDRAHFNLVIATYNSDLITALQLSHGTLRNKQGVGFRCGHSTDSTVL